MLVAVGFGEAWRSVTGQAHGNSRLSRSLATLVRSSCGADVVAVEAGGTRGWEREGRATTGLVYLRKVCRGSLKARYKVCGGID
jgi:hypothetical protein